MRRTATASLLPNSAARAYQVRARSPSGRHSSDAAAGPFLGVVALRKSERAAGASVMRQILENQAGSRDVILTEEGGCPLQHLLLLICRKSWKLGLPLCGAQISLVTFGRLLFPKLVWTGNGAGIGAAGIGAAPLWEEWRLSCSRRHAPLAQRLSCAGVGSSHPSPAGLPLDPSLQQHSCLTRRKGLAARTCCRVVLALHAVRWQGHWFGDRTERERSLNCWASRLHLPCPRRTRKALVVSVSRGTA